MMWAVNGGGKNSRRRGFIQPAPPLPTGYGYPAGVPLAPAVAGLNRLRISWRGTACFFNVSWRSLTPWP
jgi:hypothetical protein